MAESIYARYGRPVRGPATADRLKCLEVREERAYQRSVWIPSLSGLRSKDTGRKARLAWLESLGRARFIVSRCPLSLKERERHLSYADNAATQLRDYPWVSVLP